MERLSAKMKNYYIEKLKSYLMKAFCRRGLDEEGHRPWRRLAVLSPRLSLRERVIVAFLEFGGHGVELKTDAWRWLRSNFELVREIPSGVA